MQETMVLSLFVKYPRSIRVRYALSWWGNHRVSSLNHMRIVRAEEFHSGSGIVGLSVVALEEGIGPRCEGDGQCALAQLRSG